MAAEKKLKLFTMKTYQWIFMEVGQKVWLSLLLANFHKFKLELHLLGTWTSLGCYVVDTGRIWLFQWLFWPQLKQWHQIAHRFSFVFCVFHSGLKWKKHLIWFLVAESRTCLSTCFCCLIHDMLYYTLYVYMNKIFG